MPRKGRDLELLINHIESLLNDNDELTIKSPDFLLDHVTGQKREVDISINGKIGSHQILIVLECRKRQNKDDSTWIEQLGNKKQDLHINKLIAVSSSGFTEPAITKANLYGIDLRQIEKIQISDIEEWVKHFTFEQVDLKYNIQKLDIGMMNKNNANKIDGENLKPPIKSAKYSKQSDEKIFKIKDKDGKTIDLSIHDLILLNIDNNFVFYSDVNISDDKVNKTINFYFYNPEQMAYIEIENDIFRVIHILMNVDLWKEKILIPVDSTYSYTKNDETIAQVIQYKLLIQNKKATFTIQHDLKDNKQNAVLYFTEE